MARQNDNRRIAKDELREHYDFDYGKARPNRFAERLSKEAIVVVLDPDVATVFNTSESVNDALRVFISTVSNLTPSPKPAEDIQRTVPLVASAPF